MCSYKIIVSNLILALNNYQIENNCKILSLVICPEMGQRYQNYDLIRRDAQNVNRIDVICWSGHTMYEANNNVKEVRFIYIHTNSARDEGKLVPLHQTDIERYIGMGNLERSRKVYDIITKALGEGQMPLVTCDGTLSYDGCKCVITTIHTMTNPSNPRLEGFVMNGSKANTRREIHASSVTSIALITAEGFQTVHKL
jgi:hypothetical protein